MKDKEVFGFQYLSELLFTATRPGRTIFTIHVGGVDYDVYQNFSTNASNARSVASETPKQSALIGTDAATRFQVVDRFGNGYANVPVVLSQTGGELVSDANVTTDTNGFVTATVRRGSAATPGEQTVTATIAADGKSQIGNAANPELGVPASVTTVSASVNWSNVYGTTAPTISGAAKVGQVLKASPGTWKSNGSPAMSYAWFTCKAAKSAALSAASAALTGCTAIRGATKSSFAIPNTLVGSFIAVRVTATAQGQTIDASSATTAKVKK